ncbi:MAG TPA: M48 family metallopeptidase [Kofleriaceae bacterium]|nr:M48 family metallopeptidase [Kofleriaceae bacterium]
MRGAASLLAAALALGAGCARPRHLGTEVPAPCTARDVEGCLGWMMERDLAAVELGLYEDARLRGYVQTVVDRLARAARLPRSPRVLIGDQNETYATAGRRIVVARTTIEKLGSEAELAGILAHELAHIEARHVMVSLFGRPPGEDPLVDRRDAEAVADERAVWLLERAGYAPSAMARALLAVLEAEDPEHPPRKERVARVAALAGGRAGFEGRAELLGHLDGMVYGRDPRLGQRVDDAWVVPVLGVALDLGLDDDVRTAGELLALQRGDAQIVAYAVGAPWARELTATLEDRRDSLLPLGRATAGTVPAVAVRRPDDSPLGKLGRAIRSTYPQPPAGARVAIVERPAGALVFELPAGRGDMPRLPLRAPTEAELVRTEPRRIVIERAARAGAIGALGACQGRLLDDPARKVAAGDPIKCADRPARRSPLLAVP